MVRQKPIPPKLVLPNFLKLILQNQVETQLAEEEAAQKIDQSEDEEGDTTEELQGRLSPLPTENDGDFSSFTVMAQRSAHQDGFEPAAPLEVTQAGQFYLAKEKTGRRGADPDPTKDVTETLHRRWSRSVWRQELNNMEPVYRLPALILRRFRYIKEVEPTRIGPGTYDVDYDKILKCHAKEAIRGVMTNCTERFPEEKQTEVATMPGPGSYGDPYETWEKACDKCKHSGKVTLFESGPCDVRTVMAVKEKNPGPGTYRFKTGIEELLDKQTSIKGPYNLYSAPRDVIPYGYFQTRKVNSLGPGQYNIRTSLKQQLSNCCNHHKGKLAPTERFRSVTGERMTLVSPLWPPKKECPGPGHYTPEPIFPAKKDFKFGFNSSMSARPQEKLNYDMAPDKYRPELWDKRKSMTGHGWKSDFMSKTGRVDLLKIRVLTERLRGQNIPDFQREKMIGGAEEPKLLDISKIHCKEF